MNRYDDGQLRQTIQMWRRVNDSIRNCGYHISNARLFVLTEMIAARIEADYYGEDKFHPIMTHIVMLIEEAKKATANAKVIYLFIIEDWLQRLIKMIDEGLKEEDSLLSGPFFLVRDYKSDYRATQLPTLVSERITPNEPDNSMGDIPL